MKVENHKPEKPKPVRRKTATDSLIAPLLESAAKTSQQSSAHKTESNAVPSTGSEKKHTRHFSLDVHPYILSSKKTKPEIPAIPSMPTSKSQEGGFLNQEENVIVHVTSSLKGTVYCNDSTTFTDRDFCSDLQERKAYLNFLTYFARFWDK